MNADNPFDSDSIIYTVENMPSKEHQNVLEIELTGSTDRKLATGKFLQIALALLRRLGLEEPKRLVIHLENALPITLPLERHHATLSIQNHGQRISVASPYLRNLSSYQRVARTQSMQEKIRIDIERLKRERLERLAAARQKLQTDMEKWYILYSANISSFKTVLARVVASFEGKSDGLGVNCRRLTGEIVALRKKRELFLSPDKRVGDGLSKVLQEFGSVSRHCVGGRVFEARRALKKANLILRSFANSLEVYSLDP